MTKAKDDLSIEYLRSRLAYEPENGKLYWKPVGPDFGKYWTQWNGKRAACEAGNLSDQGYRTVYLDGRNYKGHRLAWTIFYGYWPVNDIDHVDNTDRANNSIENLREATRGQNLANRRTLRDGLKGVVRGECAWLARIAANGVVRHIGSFQTEQEAHDAYCKVAAELHGEYARTA